MPEEDFAVSEGNIMHVPAGAVVKVEVTVYEDGSISVKTHPSEEAGVEVMDLATSLLKGTNPERVEHVSTFKASDLPVVIGNIVGEG